MIRNQVAMQNRSPTSKPAHNPPTGKLILTILIVCGIGAFFFFDLGQYLSLDALKHNRDQLLSFTELHYAASVMLFILAYVIVAGMALPGAVILTLAGGFLFGSVLGTLFVNVGATTGAVFAFLTARYLLRDWVENKFGKWLQPLQEGIARDAFTYLLTLRLIPIFPFFALNLVSGLTRMSVRSYVSATALGIIPGSFVYAYAGRQLGTIDSIKDIASPHVVGAFVLLGLLALMPLAYKKWKGRTA